MKYTAKRNPASAASITLLLYVLGLVLFLLPSYIPMSYGAILQLLGIIALSFAVQYTIRYMLTDYTYELYDTADESHPYPLLNIYRAQGQRNTLLASASFDVMMKIEKMPKIVDNVQIAANYCPAMRPKDVYRILWQDGKKTKAIYLACDEAFAAAIAERIALYGKDCLAQED